MTVSKQAQAENAHKTQTSTAEAITDNQTNGNDDEHKKQKSANRERKANDQIMLSAIEKTMLHRHNGIARPKHERKR